MPDFAEELADALLLAKTQKMARHEQFMRSDVIRVFRAAGVRPPAKKHPPTRSAEQTEVDAVWLAELEANPTYQGIDVKRELGKAQAWASSARHPMTRRRFINWLNRCERPIAFNGQGASSKPANGQRNGIPEPARWREWARANMTDPGNANRAWASFDLPEQKYIAAETQKSGLS